MFIATGRGIEGALPDAVAATIIRHNITPYFKESRYAEGIASGLSAIMAAINGEYAPYASYGEEESSIDEMDGLLFFLVMGAIIFILFYPRGGSRYVSPSAAEQLGRVIINSRRSGGFGGGFGGGSFGGGSMAAVIALEVVPPVVAVLVAAGSTGINTFLNFTFIKE